MTPRPARKLSARARAIMAPEKPKRELTPAQRTLGVVGLKHRGTGPKNVHAEKTCAYCPKTFTPRTGNQVTCGDKTCKVLHQRKLAAAWLVKNPKTPKGPKPAAPAAGAPAAPTAPTAAKPKLTMEEMKAIRDRVYGSKPRRSAALAATEVPSELAQAEREAAQE